MSQQDRKTLKNYFSAGSLPASQHYRDLIDSMVTWKDDGFDKSREEGWRMAATETGALASYYKGVGEPEPDWTLALDKSNGTLNFKRQIDGQQMPGVAMNPDGRIGIGNEEPEWRLDVEGIVRMRGRIGFPRPDGVRTVPADGEWHDITEVLDGCHAIEVMAGVGGERYKGHYAMIHATALNAYNPRNWFLNWLFRRKYIRKQTAVFGSYADRLRLRWETVTDANTLAKANEGAAGRGDGKFYRPYRLQIKTSTNYGEKFKIRFYTTRLWFDSIMEGSRSDDVDRDPGLK